MSGPSLRERMRPVELVAIAAGLGVFTGAVILLATRELPLASIFAGIAFILTLLILAMLALAAGEPRDPNGTPILDRERKPRR